MKYTKVTIYTTSDGVDLVCAALYDLGITGVQIMDRRDFEEFMAQNLRAWDVVDEDLANAMLSEESAVTFYLEEGSTALLETVKQALSLPDNAPYYGRITTEQVADEDWVNNWKQYYRPLRIGEHVIIKPTWENAEISKGDIVVELDPGMAFGTGSHASTAMCLEYLEKIIRPGDRVLDIGTGSGILAIAALKMGASSADAVDIDPMAVKIAKDNAAQNGFREPVFTVKEGDLADRITEQYDVVIANIVADIIVELTKTVGRYIKEDGRFITSGIIDFKATRVKEALAEAKLSIVDEKKREDWNAFLCRRLQTHEL